VFVLIAVVAARVLGYRFGIRAELPYLIGCVSTYYLDRDLGISRHQKGHAVRAVGGQRSSKSADRERSLRLPQYQSRDYLPHDQAKTVSCLSTDRRTGWRLAHQHRGLGALVTK